MECLFKTLEAFGGLVDRSDICLTDEWLCRGGADHRAEPSQVSRAPSGLARIADLVAEPEGCETTRGSLEVTDGPRTSPGEITPGVVCHVGDIDGCEGARPQQPSPWHRDTAVGCDPIARLLRKQRRGDDPADVPLWGQITLEPLAAGARFVNALVEVTLAGADRPEGDDRRAMVLGHVGDRHGLCIDIHADIKSGRLGPG